MTAPRPSSAATSPRGRRSRCTRRPRRSPRTTGSSSTCSPPTARPGRAGSSGRSRSCATTSWPAAASARPRSWTGRSTSGCRSAAPSATAPTASSIGVRAQVDHAALRPLPELPYLVCDRHLRRVGRDCLISFEGSHYSIPARAGDGRPARAGQRVELRVSADTVTIHRLAGRRRPDRARRPRPRPRAAARWWSTPRTGTGYPTGTPAPSPSTRHPTRPAAWRAASPTRSPR